MSAGDVSEWSQEPQQTQQGDQSVCSKCWTSLPRAAMFCSTCGHIQIRNSLIQESTTAEYDPRSRDYKPWREISRAAPNSWKDRNQMVLVRRREPWRPAMSQSRVYLKKGTGKPTLIPWSSPEKNSDVQGESAGGSEDARRRYERVSSKRILTFRGRLWCKSGDSYRKKKTIFTSDMIYGYVPKGTDYVGESEELTPPITLFPLGIYPLEGILSQDALAFSVHLTLLRRSFQSKYDHTLSVHWLRVGYEVERMDVSSTQAESEGHRQFSIVAYLPNCIAKCFGAAVQGTWVDLQYIEHLQIALSPIADRVVSASSCHDRLLDQRFRILAESFGTHFQVEDESTADHLPDPLLKRVHSMAEDLVTDDEDHWCDSEDYTGTACGFQGIELKFESFVAKISVGIPVGAYYLNRKVMCTVYLDILWKHDSQDDLLVSSEQREDDDSDSGTSTPNLSIPRGHVDEIDWLTQVPLIEGISLRIYPTYYDGQLLRPKMISIGIDSLSDLLIPEVKSFEENDGEGGDINFGDNTSAVSQHLLRQLELGGASGARSLCREIVSLLRFEYTTNGLRLFVHGVDSPYSLCDSPEMAQRLMRTREFAATRIQAVWRGRIGRTLTARMREIRDRMIELQRIHAMTQIQRMIRGFIARRRYLAIVLALSMQRSALETQGSLALESVSTPEEAHPISPAPLVVLIKGTEVEISLDAELTDQTNLPTKGFCDCLITVIDVTSRRAASVVIPAATLSRFWNLFKRLPIEFQRAMLRVRHLKLTDLKQVDLIGRNDPYVMLSYGNRFKRQTDSIAEGGNDVEWKISAEQEVDFQFPVEAEELSTEDHALEVAVYDANQFRSDVLIGEVNVPLTPIQLLTSYGEEVTLTREIKKKGKVTGSCALTFDLQKLSMTSAAEESGGGEEQYHLLKSSIHSLADLLTHPSLTADFLRFLARRHLDLFLSRANGVMVLRIIG